MGHRRKSREYALQGLYSFEIGKLPLDDVLKLDWADDEIETSVREFAVLLISGTVKNLEKIDELIIRHSRNWEFERISGVDKSILRLSIYSLLFLKDIPDRVTINEAIELGKTYGGETSGAFINGILDAVNKTNSSG